MHVFSLCCAVSSAEWVWFTVPIHANVKLKCYTRTIPKRTGYEENKNEKVFFIAIKVNK